MSLEPLNLDLAAPASTSTQLSPSNGACLLSPTGVTTQSDLDTDACVELALRDEVASPDIQCLVSANRKASLAMTPVQPSIPEANSEITDVVFECDDVIETVTEHPQSTMLELQSEITFDEGNIDTIIEDEQPLTFTSDVIIDEASELEFSADISESMNYNDTSHLVENSESSHESVDSQYPVVVLMDSTEERAKSDVELSSKDEVKQKRTVNVSISIECPYYDYSPNDVNYRPAAQWCDRFATPSDTKFECHLPEDISLVDDSYCQRMLYAAGFTLISYADQNELIIRQLNVPIAQFKDALVSGVLEKAIDVEQLLNSLRQKLEKDSESRVSQVYDVTSRAVHVDTIRRVDGEVERETTLPSQVKRMQFQPAIIQPMNYRKNEANRQPTKPIVNPATVIGNSIPQMGPNTAQFRPRTLSKPHVHLPGTQYPFGSSKSEEFQGDGHLRYVGSRY